MECTKSESALARRRREERARDKVERKARKGQQQFAMYAEPRADKETISSESHLSYPADISTNENESVSAECERDGKAPDDNDIESVEARKKAVQQHSKQRTVERKVEKNEKERELEQIRRERKGKRASGEGRKKRTAHLRNSGQSSSRPLER